MGKVKTTLVRIGNSQGVRIPKVLVEQCGLSGELELEPAENGLVIRPAHAARRGWDAAFEEMRAQGDDELLVGGAGDDEEWEWS